MLLQKAGHATASVVVHEEVELTIVYATRSHRCNDVRSLPRCAGLVDGLPHKLSVGGVPGMMCLSMNGCAMSNLPNRGGDVVDFRSVNADENVDGQDQREVKKRDVVVVQYELSRKGEVSVGLERCLLGCRRRRRLQLIWGCWSPS